MGEYLFCGGRVLEENIVNFPLLMCKQSVPLFHAGCIKSYLFCEMVNVEPKFFGHILTIKYG